MKTMKFVSLNGIFFLIALFFVFNGYAQKVNDPVIMTIGNEEVKKSEFLNVYNKNNNREKENNKEALNEYVELFINFKLKVKEAEELGLDTVSSFINELAGYRKQLAEPYFKDRQVDDNLIKEAYERSKYDIRASHILIRLDPEAKPEDTLIAYNKIMDIRSGILDGEDFGKAAEEMSEDPSARDREATKMRPFMKGNKGDLGYFTVFDMVYPFESGAYATEPGNISMPVRTNYGYHIIKVTDKMEAMGRVHAAHIFVRIPQDATAEDSLKAKEKIFEVYEKVMDGEDFSTLARQYSDDKSSANKGGELPWFGSNRMVPDFIEAVAKLKNDGDISEPVLTQYGWHIIKLLERKGIGSFEEMEKELTQKVSRDNRSLKSRQSTLLKIKEMFSFKENNSAKELFYSIVTDTVFFGKWSSEGLIPDNEEIFSLDGQEVTQNDFAEYIEKNQKPRTRIPVNVFVDEMFDSFVEETCFDLYDKRLEDLYPEFRLLMKEYRDGILLFELTDRKVWSKAVKDTVGLEKFYGQHKNDYMWGDRVRASIVSSANEDILQKARDIAPGLLNGKLSEEAFLSQMNGDSLQVLTIKTKKFAPEENEYVDRISVVPGISETFKDGKNGLFVIAYEKTGPEQKTIDEARGLITADYQNYLEKEWINELRKKYSFTVNKKVVESILK